jgi:hypothetical protein
LTSAHQIASGGPPAASEPSSFCPRYSISSAPLKRPRRVPN